MTPRKSRFPRPPFDQVHADAIESATYDHNGMTLLRDLNVSRSDREEGRPWVVEADIAYTESIRNPPVAAVRNTRPVEPYYTRKSRHVAAWVTGYLFVAVLVLLVIAMVVSA